MVDDVVGDLSIRPQQGPRRVVGGHDDDPGRIRTRDGTAIRPAGGVAHRVNIPETTRGEIWRIAPPHILHA